MLGKLVLSGGEFLFQDAAAVTSIQGQLPAEISRE